MPDPDDEVSESPATWENIVDGEVKEIVGRLTNNEELVEQGKDEVEVAREVREEYREEHDKQAD